MKTIVDKILDLRQKLNEQGVPMEGRMLVWCDRIMASMVVMPNEMKFGFRLVASGTIGAYNLDGTIVK